MEIEIVDPLKKLSKNQKQKIKGSFKDGKTIQDVLNQIHYTEETFRYKDLRVENVSEKLTRLTFKETSHLEDLRNKLRNKDLTHGVDRYCEYTFRKQSRRFTTIILLKLY